MRELSPEANDAVDVVERYRSDTRPTPVGRPWVVINMVASIDGATATGGVSGGLSSPADRAAFHALRSIADVILVGAGTVRAEGYGPPRTSPEDQALRLGRGQAAFPRIAIVSGRLDLDPTTPLFVEAPAPPYVITGTGDAEREAALAEVAEVVHTGDGPVDLTVGLARLHHDGATIVLAEGGPTLNGHLLAAGLVDEVCLTLAPSVAGGTSARVAVGPSLEPPERLTLDRVLEDDGFLLLRYVRKP